MQQAARFYAVIYDSTGTTAHRTLGADLFLNVPKIVREVNKPAGAVAIELALPWDNFGEGTTINAFDLVKLYAVNDDNPSGVLVYQGHIEEIEGVYDENNNHVALTLYPIDSLIGKSLWKKASYEFTYNTSDVDTIMSDLVDDVNTIYGATFFTKNLGDPGLSITQTYKRVTHQAVLQSAAKFLTDGWYWRINSDGQVDLGQYNDSTADHLLVMGKTVASARVKRSLVDVKNKIVVRWGSPGTDNEYSDATSMTDYGRRMTLIEDTGIADLSTANVKGNGQIATLKDIFTSCTLTVNALYPIETIKPGDTVQVTNISGNTSQMLAGVYRIVRVEYDGATATLTLSDIVNNFGVEFTRAIA